MKPMLKKELFSEERKMILNRVPRYVMCPVCANKVPYTKRGGHRCLRMDFHEMDSRIQRGSW